MADVDLNSLQFKKFRKQDEKEAKSLITSKLGLYQHPEKGELDYYSLFNHDVQLFNTLLETLPSEYKIENEYTEVLNQRDVAYTRAETRWERSEKEIHVAATFMKDLIFWEQKCKEVQVKRNSYYEHINEIENFFSENRTNEIFENWKKQGHLIKANLDDLLLIYEQLESLQSLFDLFSLQKWQNDPISTELKNKISYNQKLLLIIRRQCIVALLWKLQAGVVSQNLYFDDSLYAVKRALSLPVATVWHSYDMDPAKFSYCLNIVRRNASKSENKKLEEILLQWKNNKKHTYSLGCLNKTLIPQELLKFIPKYPTFWPTHYIRYWFFHASKDEIGYLAWIRDYFLGSYFEEALYLNEAIDQLTWLEEKITVLNEKNQNIDLEKMKNLIGFRWAVDIHPLLGKEIARTRSVLSSWFVRIITLRWKDPVLLRWLGILTNSQKVIQKKCNTIVANVLQNFNNIIFQSMKNRTFVLSKETISAIKNFITLYGNTTEIDQFKRISSPLQMICQYSFFKEESSEDYYRNIDSDAVFGFHYFAEKFWNAEELPAIEAILDLIERKNIPHRNADLEALYNKLLPILETKNKKASFKTLMTFIAKEIYFYTGDDGSENMLWFMNKYAPDIGKVFRQDREKHGTKKYAFLILLFSQNEGSEHDLLSVEPQSIQGVEFYNNMCSKYIRDIHYNHSNVQNGYKQNLKKEALKYINHFNGSNLAYFELVKMITRTFLDHELFKTYILKHFLWIIQNSSEKNPYIATANHTSYYTSLVFYTSIRNALIKLLDESPDDCLGLQSVIELMNHPELTAAFYANQLRNYLAKGDYNKILQYRENYEKLLDRPAFSTRVHHIIAAHFGSKVQNAAHEELSSESCILTLEWLGSVRNKEAYRLWCFKNIIHEQNYYQTVKYITLLANCYKEKRMVFFSLKASQDVLCDIFKFHLSEELRSPKWSGHTQYMLEEFVPPEAKYLLEEFRLRWLENYLFHYEYFAERGKYNCEPLDVRSNLLNSEIPNQSNSLELFYAKSNIVDVKKIVLARLDKFDPDLPDNILDLIEKYTKDPAIMLTPDYPAISGKLDIYREILSLAREVQKGNMSIKSQDAYCILKIMINAELDQASPLSVYRASLFRKLEKLINENEKQVRNSNFNFKALMTRLLKDRSSISKSRYLKIENSNELEKLISRLDDKAKNLIEKELLLYINDLLKTSIDQNDLLNLPDWCAASHLLQMLSIDLSEKVKTHWEDAQRVIEKLKNELADWQKSGSLKIPSDDVRKQEHELICRIVFIKKFGNPKATRQCDQFIAEVLNRWKEAVETGSTGLFYDHSFAFAKTLISLVGSLEQQQLGKDIDEAWQYRARKLRKAC